MSRRVLIIEPDASGRSVMDRLLTSEGHAVDAVASMAEARPLLDRGPPVELAIVDQIGARGAILEDVRQLRRAYPALPVVVIGALLSQRVMQELLRLRVVDALGKPFTPDELRDAVTRALECKAARHDEALEYAAALEAAQRAFVLGRLDDVAPALRRAQATSPLDAEVTALWALLAELEGRDDDADRGYRAAIALRREEDTPPPDPFEGLARLSAYGGARPVEALGSSRDGIARWVVCEPTAELCASPPAGAAPSVVVMSLGLATDGRGAIYLRDGDGDCAFALVTGPLRAESAAAALARLGGGPVVVAAPTRARMDVAGFAPPPEPVMVAP